MIKKEEEKTSLADNCQCVLGMATCKEQCSNYFYTGIYMYMSINVHGKKKKKVSDLEIQSTSILCVQLSISLVYLLFPLYIQFLQQRCFCCELQAGNKIKIADKVNEIRYLNIKVLQISWDVIQLSNQCSLNSFEVCKML